MPHLEIRPNINPYTESKDLSANKSPDGGPTTFSINSYPSQEVLNRAFHDFVTFLNWTKVAILYEDDLGERFLILFYS